MLKIDKKEFEKIYSDVGWEEFTLCEFYTKGGALRATAVVPSLGDLAIEISLADLDVFVGDRSRVTLAELTGRYFKDAVKTAVLRAVCLHCLYDEDGLPNDLAHQFPALLNRFVF